MIIDCSASAEVAAQLRGLAVGGIHVVTPNKKANSAAYGDYQRHRGARAGARASHYLYEATVGAGLPVIQTLRDLRETGDEIHRIEGIFSGTLAYLFNTCDGRSRSRRSSRQAKTLGYTEPDPRDDLSGIDVARKLIILGARDGAAARNSRDVQVESLVPARARRVRRRRVPATRLAEFDAADARAPRRRARARARCCATSARWMRQGEAQVGLVELPTSHPFANIALTDNIVRFQTRATTAIR